MLRIGIITLWRSSDNYGQVLQCYALQEVLRNMGHDVYLIKYAPGITKKTIWQKIKNHMQHPAYILDHLPFETARKREFRTEYGLKLINVKNNSLREFCEFKKKHIKMTEYQYNSFRELKKNPPKADVYIVGSDQVWHTSYNEESALGWFLQFGDDNVRRISYAASIGRNIKDSEKKIFQQYLAKFDAISVREESARRLCSEVGFKAQTCIDPTMLLPIDTYRKLYSPLRITCKYTFIYVLNVKKTEDFFWPLIKVYVESSHLQIKSVTGSGYCQGRELIEGNTNILATIPEWLTYIENATSVLTNSFHGTIFSILMHRKFLTIELQGKYGKSNTRIHDLLLSLGLSERILKSTLSVKDQMEKTIDWEKVDEKLLRLRISSLNFLIKNLSYK